ncbi:MAG: HlyC/CorC family transporter [Alphaproteobacteria bacterium]|nr:HlyC/CorC family transporter [Alphaproteobacteria bacterium]
MDPSFDIIFPLPIATAVILALLAVSAFYSVAETALTSSSRGRLTTLANHGNARARRVLRLRDQQEEALAAILLGNNLVNMVASSVATGALIQAFGDAGVAYAAVVMTILVVLFGEVLPKTVGLINADRVILTIEPAVSASVYALGPLSRAVNWIVGHVIALFRRRPLESEHVRAAEELRGAIELHAAPEASVKQEREMLRSILDLANVTVGQIMVHRNQVVALDIDQDPGKVLELALSSPHTRIPLYRGGSENIVGVLHAKAMLQALRSAGGRPEKLVLSQIATRPWFIPDTTTLLDQLQAFRRRREHFAVVVDEYGALLGIVTLEDILEEIVGDIAERHEFQVPGVRPQPDGSWLVDGTVTIRDLNRELDWRLPDEPAATIAGLVLHESRVIPDIGQVFVFHGLRFEVLRRKRNQIVLLRISRFEPAATDRSAATSPAGASS